MDPIGIFELDPDVIAPTHREIQDRADSKPSQEAAERLLDLRQRRTQLQESIRTLLSLGDRNGFIADELKRLFGGTLLLFEEPPYAEPHVR